MTVVPIEKLCKGCNTSQPHSSFYHSKRDNCLSTLCKPCHISRGVANRRKNPSSRRKATAKYYARVRLTPRWRFRNHVSSARGRGLGNSLTFDHFKDLTSQPCTYCDQFSPGHDYVGIDQLIPGAGYDLANCIPCCSVCNRMKSDMPLGDFLAHIQRIAL